MEEVLDLRGVAPTRNWAARLVGWLRRVAQQPAAGAAPLRLESRLNLGPKKSLVLVNCCGRRVLLAVAGDAVTPVMELAVARARTPKGPAR